MLLNHNIIQFKNLKMKKLLFLFSFLLVAGVSVNAQETAKKCAKKCSKTCAKKASATASTASATQVAAAVTEAEIAANESEDIKMKECSVSGTKSYYQKSVCEKSGSVSWNAVEYCTKSKAFKKVASASMERDVETGKTVDTSAKSAKKSCKKSCKKTCSKKAASSL